jgi:predicted GNAT family acetyltransferase
VRALNPKARTDNEALRRLFGSTDISDWERGGVEFDHPVIFGAFEGETLVAAASAVPWSARLDGVAVFTHPGHRRQGWARRVTRALCRHATVQGHAVQIAAPEGDAAAMGLARTLGFRDYAQTIAVVFPH